MLQFALNRKRDQENQKAINTLLNRNPLNTFEQISNIKPSQRSQAYNPRPRFPARNPQPQRNFNTPNTCRRCGLQFTQEHLLICPAKKIPCNLCKKIGHYSKVCRSAKLMWQTQQIRPQQNVNQQNIPQTRRVRNIRPTPDQQQIPTQNQDTHSETNDESIDLENTFFIQEVFDSWNTVNLIKPKTFHNAQPHKLSPNISDEIWIKTTSDMTEIDWLADTGVPRSFVCKAEKKNPPTMQIRQMERPHRMPNQIQMLQQHRDPNHSNNPTEAQFGTSGSSQQRNTSGRRKHREPTRTRHPRKAWIHTLSK